MKKAKKATTKRRRSSPPAVRENELWLMAREFCELYSMADMIQNSYVLSRFWAWLSQIELNPNVRIPVPRFLTHRDP